ncbi:MAG: membrane protein insertion efficiency factor YidD [Candidatus Aceula meridiana]|nr:membrane protein insertion efficiency factor YidD [Candidatus Aceula meridiana]
MIAKVLHCIIRMYQSIKKLFGFSTCRFYPTCSEYAILALEKYGATKGSAKAIKRILRCSPLSRGGYDPLN